MTKYQSEAHFSKAVVAHLRKRGYFVQRIETGATGRGVPDIYCVTPDGVPMWIELKREKCVLRGKDRALVHWRPGQQAWLRAASKYRQKCYTLAAFDDVMVLIPHTHIWANDTILLSQCQLLFALHDL